MMRLVKIAGRDLPASRLLRSLARGGRIVLALLCVLSLAAVALELGAWRMQFHVAGPFAAETSPAQHALVLTVPNEGTLPWWRKPLIGDSPSKPFESRLHLTIGGHEMGPAHAELDAIGNGTSQAFSHRGSSVVFSLPTGVPNSAATTVTLWYSVRVRPAVTIAIVALTALMAVLLYGARLLRMIRRFRDTAAQACRRSTRVVPWLVCAPYLMLAVVVSVGTVGAILFMGASVIAWRQGWALPTTAPLRWFASIAWAARNEPYFGHLLLTAAGLGTLSSWLAMAGGQDKLSRELEGRTLRWLKWLGLPLGVCALLLCTSAMWDGMVRAGDPHWASIGGLVPYSDAEDHLSAAFEGAKDGTLSAFAQRRPIAASFRSVLLLASGYSPPLMLMLQAGLVAAAACWAAYAVMMWRGVWAGLALFGFVYVFARTFTPTMLTEPLGLFWSLLAIPFLIEALRARSARAGLVALALVTIALMVRMGSMFTIPALMIWLAWWFGRGIAHKARLLILAIAVVGCVGGANLFLTKAFGARGGEVGGNFSYVVCGLTIGTTWVGCPQKLAEQGTPLTGDEATVASRLYAMAWHNFLDRPDVFFRRIASGAASFAEDFPSVLWFGHAAIAGPPWLFPKVLTAVILVGLVCVARRRADRTELAFWSLLWSSIFMSAALIYYDDGARTLAVSQPAIALFAAIGMMNPALAADTRPARTALVRWGSWGVACFVMLLACAPWIAHRFPPIGGGLDYASQARQGEALVFGVPRLSGFLVVDNDQPLRTDVPTLHLDAFEAIVKQAGIDQALLRPTMPSTPFGFVYAPRLERHLGGPDEFIVPADMMQQPNVRAWRLAIGRLQPGSAEWFRASRAEAWPSQGDR